MNQYFFWAILSVFVHFTSLVMASQILEDNKEPQLRGYRKDRENEKNRFARVYEKTLIYPLPTKTNGSMKYHPLSLEEDETVYPEEDETVYPEKDETRYPEEDETRYPEEDEQPFPPKTNGLMEQYQQPLDEDEDEYEKPLSLEEDEEP